MIALTGYSDKISARPGETVAFMVSAEDEAPYTADIVRLRCGDTNPEGPGFKEESIETSIGGDRHQGRRQHIQIGSCILVPWVSALAPLESFSVTAMLWPTNPGNGAVQTILSCWAQDDTGFSLSLDQTGAPALTLGNRGRAETVSTAAPLPGRQWAWVGATFDHGSGTVCLFQRALHKLAQADIDRDHTIHVGFDLSAVAAPIVIGARLIGMAGDRPPDRGLLQREDRQSAVGKRRTRAD